MFQHCSQKLIDQFIISCSAFLAVASITIFRSEEKTKDQLEDRKSTAEVVEQHKSTMHRYNY